MTQRVKGTLGGVTTVYVGEHYEVSGSAVTKYYYAGGSRVALRTTGGVRYLVGDHLGSTSVTADGSGGSVLRQLYKAWGETRGSGRVATEYGYTGQYGYEDEFGLLFYKARWYDPALGRFIQPDLIIPEPYNPLAYDRYQYVYSNPVRYTDSSGHCIDGVSTWVCVVAAIGIISKIVDYGWTTYDAWQSGQVLNDPNASQAEKDEAAANLAMAATFEGLEPDDLLPVSLPLDDLARYGMLGIVKQLPLPGFEKYVDDTGAQIHHLITNKGRYWPDVMKQITDKYKLDLNGSWNKVSLPGHSGSHTEWYHQWVYKKLQEIDAVAKGDRDLFWELFNSLVKEPVLENPRLPYNK